MSEISSGDAARVLGALRQRGLRICTQCGQEFEGYSNRKYCGRACSNAAYYAAHAEELRAERKRRYRGEKGGEQEARP